jgi:DNA-binding transcriptional LysR family regulator
MRARCTAQSVISYTIANLEEQLNVALLDRSKRKPTLTEAGKALLADARAVSLKVDGMRARAKALSAGLEAEVSLVVDVMFSTCKLVRILHAFQKVPDRGHAPAHRGAGRRDPAGDGRACHIGISGWMPGTGRDRAPKLRLCHHGAGGGARAPAGADRGQDAHRRARTHPARADRPQHADRDRISACGAARLAPGRPQFQTCAAAQRHRLGQYAVEFMQWDLDAAKLVQLDVAKAVPSASRCT